MKKYKKRSVAAKILISCLVVALVIGLSYLGYYLIRYTFYDDYKDDYQPIEYAEGSEFKALSDSSRPEELAQEYVLAAESDTLKLYYNEVTTHVAVYDKNSGKITYSNPQNLTEDDYDNTVYLNKMNSQIIVYYYPNKSASSISEMTSYEYCTNIVKSEEDSESSSEPQYSVEAIDNGIRVIYTIGDLSSETGTVATYISKETFEDICKKLKEYDEAEGTRNLKTIQNVYTESKDVEGFYKLNDGVKKSQMRKMQTVLELVGWTEEDYEREMTASGVEFTMPTSFTIPLEYTLSDGRLKVNICTDHITETGDGSLIYIDVLPYFGSTYHVYTTDENVGYIYTVDETATSPVVVEEKTEYITVGYDGEKTIAAIDNGIAGEYSFATFTVYETITDEFGDVSQGEQIGTWNSNFGSNEVEVEVGKDYVINISGQNMAESFEKTVKFVVKPEEIPVDGYFFVPNGSGSLINLNSPECDSIAAYNEKIYGQDDVLFDTEMNVQETESAKLPVYGWYDQSSTTFVMLTRGESLAELRVQTANDKTCKASDSLTNYNTAFCRYYLRGENVVEMSTTDSFTVWTDDIFDTQLTQEYCFLTEEYQGYTGMANYYREYLIAEGALVQSEATEESSIGMYLDLIGAVKGDSTFLGFAYTSVIPLTTFEQAQEIVNAFYGNNINNLVVNYQGWMNDGYYHNTVDNIKVIRKLGGKSGLEEFTDLVESNGGKVYGDIAVNRVTYAAEDFPYTLEASRLFGTSYTAGYGKTGPTTYSNSASLGYIANLYDVLSPKYVSRYVDSALEETADINISGISYRDLGTYLYSDMKKTSVVHRERAKEIMIAQLQKAAENDKSVMLNAPLAYALAYCDDIINAPLGDNNYIYVDMEVPFYQMVIHGYINYSGSAINLSADTVAIDNILQCVEYGASPHFTFTYEPATEMKYTALNDKYATNYTNWVDEATEIYNEVNGVLAEVTTASIVNHEILDSNNQVKRITYSNGVVIIVNYSSEAFVDDGVSVAAKDFIVEVAE